MSLATSRKRGGTPYSPITQPASDPHIEANGQEVPNGAFVAYEVDSDSTASKTVSAAQVQSAWLHPKVIFLVISTLFWVCWVLTYSNYKSEHQARSVRLVPCNPSGRLLATCAHRGNAAELLVLKGDLAKDGLTSASSAISHPLKDQMTALWRAGVTCFDLDVVQLSGGEFVVGHPADLGQLAKTSSSSSRGKATALAPGLLHGHTVAELRAAGVNADAAPLLQTVLSHFAELKRSEQLTTSSHSSTNSSSSSRGSRLTAAQAAQDRKGWQGVPVLSIELKGPAASSLESWQEVASLAESAEVSDALILMVRHQGSSSRRSSSSSSEQSAVLQLATSLKRQAGSSAGDARKDTALPRPLVGLIVPDSLVLQQQQQQGDTSSSNSAVQAQQLLRRAAGLAINAPAAAPDANNTAAETAIVLHAFDVLAPSLKLPDSVLAELVQVKPAFAWTLGTTEDIHRAMRLGVDIGSTGSPVLQKSTVQRDHSKLCT